MSGIAGWVDYRRDAREQRPVLDAMVAAMADRGLDAGRTWVAQHVALGNVRLPVIDIQGGTQPMTVRADGPEGATVAAITYRGEVYNYRELRSELASRGHRFRTASDTEVVLHAYLEWGEGFAEHLNGIYAFALWDPAREQLLLVRDRIGVKPLYYALTADGLIFASEPKTIFAHPAIEPVAGAEGLREILAFAGTPERSIYQGMREVRPGCVLRLRPEGITLREYWKLEAIEHADDLDTTVSTVRELLEDIMERQLVSDVPLCLLLSGGLDSSALTSLAARTLAAQGRGPVRTFTLDFVGYSDGFRTDPLRAAPDGPFARQVAAHVGAEHTDIVLATAELADPMSRAAVAMGNDAPALGGDKFTSLYLLFAEIRRRHCAVALSGENSDVLFGSTSWPRTPPADTFPWLAGAPAELAEQLAPGGSSPFSDELLTILDIADYQRDSYRSALAEVPYIGGVSPVERRMREFCYLSLTRNIQDLEWQERMGTANGLEVRVPLADHRLVQYVFNVPWSFKVFDGREKSLLRAAVSDLLPRPVLWRKKSPYPSSQAPDYERALREDMSKLLANGTSPVLSLLDVRRTRALLDQEVPAVSLDTTRLALEGVLAMDNWLSATGTRLDISS